MSYGVVPSRHLVLALTIRGLRPRLLSLRSVVPSRHKRSYTCTFGCGSERTEICFLARAFRIIFLEKPFNPALIRTTACNQTGCECIVCTSNPSLMKGLSCPEFGRPFTDQVVRPSYKHFFLHPRREARFEPHYPQDNFHYQQDTFHYLQDNFSAHIR